MLALLRLAPVFVDPVLDVRALALAPWVLALAILVALLPATDEKPGPGLRRAGLALLVLGAVLAIVVAARGAGGLPARLSGPQGAIAELPAGPIDVAGPDLRGLPAPRRRIVEWSGPLHVPESGRYRLWADGRGAVTVSVDGRVVLAAEGERLIAGADVDLGRGARTLDVRLERVGPGPRLRLGWVTPTGRAEMLPPRRLGESPGGALWTLTDLLAHALAVLAGLLAFGLSARSARDADEAAADAASPGPVTGREALLASAGFAALAVAMSWPLAADLAGHSLMQYPDGRLNAWILAWGAHALVTSPVDVFQAPIFHPLPDAHAFTENLLLPAALAAPFTLLGGPALGYNLVLLASLALSGLGAFLLARRATGDALAAFVGAAIFAVGVHRWVRLAHLHAQVTVFLPLALLTLDRFLERRTFPRALAVALCVMLQGLSSVYLGAITATAVTACVLLALFARTLSGRDLLRLAVAGLVALPPLVAIAAPYFRMRGFQGVEFTLDDLRVYATTLESWAASGTPLWGPLSQRHLDPDRVRDGLFPGLVPLLLGLAGLARAPRRWQLAAVSLCGLSVWISLGPETAAFRFLHEQVVLFRAIRAYSRFALLVMLVLAVLSALALAGRGRWRLAALALLLFEARHAPIGTAPLIEPGDAERWLAEKPGAVAALPLGEGDTAAMLRQLGHWRPLVNGDSGFIPRPYDRAMERLAGTLDADALRYLRAVEVAHVVSETPQPLPEAARFGATAIYAVPAGETAQRPQPAAPVPTLWERGSAVADLGSPRLVSRITFELSDAPWVTQPRVERSLDGQAWEAVAAEASLADAILGLLADPRHGRGELRFAPVTTRFLRFEPALPARPGVFEAGP
ncbi:MAG: hypothetical protein NDJ94_02235 [Vicinamibacteria bacterium]|nr:hypothetical protein [Vicinamibacteria bacterium]